MYSFRYLPDRESKKSGTNNLYLHFFAKEVNKTKWHRHWRQLKKTYRHHFSMFLFVFLHHRLFYYLIFVCVCVCMRTNGNTNILVFFFFCIFLKLLSLYPWRHSSTVTTRPTQHLSKEEIWRRRWHREKVNSAKMRNNCLLVFFKTRVWLEFFFVIRHLACAKKRTNAKRSKGIEWYYKM